MKINRCEPAVLVAWKGVGSVEFGLSAFRSLMKASSVQPPTGSGRPILLNNVLLYFKIVGWMIIGRPQVLLSRCNWAMMLPTTSFLSNVLSALRYGSMFIRRPKFVLGTAL